MGDMYSDCVYLKELDSVRISSQEQKDAEKALFHALVFEGKRVVMTYNQIGDSLAFLHCISKEENAEYIYRFFKSQRILVNQYKQEMNLSKYIQDSLDNQSFSSSYFYFLKEEEREIVYSKMKLSIQYSDDMFVKNIPVSKSHMNEILQYIKTILTINMYFYENHSKNYIPSYQYNFHVNFLDILKQIAHAIEKTPYSSALNNIYIHECIQKGYNYRSIYLDTIQKNLEKENQYLASELIHLAYNQTLETSIFGYSQEIDLSKEIQRIQEKQSPTLSSLTIEDVVYPWEDGYRAMSMTLALYQLFHERVSWHVLLKCVPILEIMRLIVSVAMTLFLMNVSDFFDFVQSNLISGVLGIAVSLLMDWVMSLCEDKMSSWLPEWCITSPVEEIRYFFRDIKLLWLRKKDYGKIK